MAPGSIHPQVATYRDRTTAGHAGGVISGATLASSIGYGEETAAARESHNPMEMSLLSATVAELEKEWVLLVQRLAPALPQEKASECPAEDSIDAYRVPLANDIRLARRSVERVIGYVRTVASKIEL